ncbi:DUF4932 domain-containing protein [Thermococcus aciditolerans]|uniref:DUF4932 domain-containing protein n=1 Tax=Thermococcus aciditolerans TaxID=2598455 RepID=A0A5C0SMN7_9EURY|nr:DUF4932 domain-containing protein [Thermococcus aciditolerans]QEK14149.1 DUF4932 domain-containing protein [Thermococcus aciditolerans]
MKKLASLVLVFLVVLASGCVGTTGEKVQGGETKSPTTASMQEHTSGTPVSISLSDRLHVEIDPRVELVAIIYRLSDSSWYREHVDPAVLGVTPGSYRYIRDVDEYFGPYRNLTAVKIVPQMIEEGIDYDAIPEFAIHLSPTDFSKAMPWDDMLRLRPFLDAKKLDEFAEAVAEFAEETDFWRFYREHEEFYNRTLETFVGENPGLVELVEFEEDFFGKNASSWHVVPMPLFCCHGFGYHIESGSNMSVYAFLGFGEVAGGIPHVYATVGGSSFLAHEFAHSFVNPAVDQHYELFEPYEALFDPVAEKLREMAYPNFKVMLYETLVRAFEAYYLNATGRPEGATATLKGNRKVFYFIDDVYRAYVDDYLKHREEYRTFDDFMQELARVIARVYSETNGGKNVVIPLTVEDFLNAAKEGGVIVAYDDGSSAGNLARFVYDSFRRRGVDAELKTVSSLTPEDMRKNLALVLLSNSTLLPELQRNAPVIVNGTTVYSRESGETYSGSLRVFEVIENPWDPDAIVLMVIATDKRALGSIHIYRHLTYSIRDALDDLLESG